MPREAAFAPPVTAATSAIPRLEVSAGSQRTDGGLMRLRGSVRNPWPATVEGVRLVLRIYAASHPGARELEPQQRELGVTLASGESAAVSWDVQSSYALGASAFSLEAYPQRYDGRAVDAPPGWQSR